MVVSEMLHGIRKGFPAYNGREMPIGLSVAIEGLVIIVLKSSFKTHQLTRHLGS